MRIFYNPETRQQIVATESYACSFYLQADETPPRKAIEILKAYNDNNTNVSICEEIIEPTTDKPLPVEDGPEKEEPQHSTEPTNGDDLTN